MRFMLFTLLAVLFFPALGAGQTTWYVPDHFSSIQGAIKGVKNNHTIVVRPGVYKENINFAGKAIELRSLDGPDVTVIDGKRSGSVVTFNNKEGPASILEGFTITNGVNNSGGGGIICQYASPTIINNKITKNSSMGAGAGGGGMHNYNSSPIVTNCVFSWNMAASGAGMNNGYSSPDVTRCIFMMNSANQGGGMSNNISSPNIKSCVFSWNSSENGGGIHNYYSSPKISDCAFWGNSAKYGGGVDNCFSSDLLVMNCAFTRNTAIVGGGMYNHDSSPVVTQCTFSRNSGGVGGGIGVDPFMPGAPKVSQCVFWGDTTHELNISKGSVTYSCIQGGYSGVGNIKSDPLLIGGSKGFYYLSQKAAGQPLNSPCVDSGGIKSSLNGMDLLWTRTDGFKDKGMVDMGFHYGPFLFPSLQTDCSTLSAGVGGKVNLLLLTEKVNGGRSYMVFGGVSGVNPGNPLPGGYVTLPLNWDLFTNLVLVFVNTPVFQNFMGTLNSKGESIAIFNSLGPVAGKIGLSMCFSFALNNPWNYVSNPVRIQIDP